MTKVASISIAPTNTFKLVTARLGSNDILQSPFDFFPSWEEPSSRGLWLSTIISAVILILF